MKTIYKYQIQLEDYFELKLPKNARILHFGLQDEKTFIWVLIDTKENRYDTRAFRLAGTGHPIQDNINDLLFIGTIIYDKKKLVFHLFEII